MCVTGGGGPGGGCWVCVWLSLQRGLRGLRVVCEEIKGVSYDLVSQDVVTYPPMVVTLMRGRLNV